MKKTILILIAAFTSSCYSPINDTQYKIDPMAQPYLDQFYQIADSYQKHFDCSNLLIIVQYGLADQLHCDGLTTLRSNGGQRQIEFDYEFWVESSESIKQVLTLHEFGHAFLGRVHTTDYSIMNPQMGNKGWPLINGKEVDHKILLNELFANANH